MRFFAKSNIAPGWLAVTLEADGVRAVHVRREPNAQPCVESALFLPGRPDDAKVVLERLCKDMRCDRHRVTTLLAGGDFQMVAVEAPNVPPDELKIAIRWRVKDLLDFHVDDATVDVLGVPLDKNAPVRNQSLYVVAARNSIIQQRQAQFEQARIPLCAIDIPELAQRNLAALAETEGRGLALLSFGPEGGLLTVTYDQELCLSRRIDIRFEQIQHAAPDEKTALLDRITLELQRSLDHVDRQFHFITLSKLLVAPLGGDDAGLKAYLSTNLYLPVEGFALESVINLERVPDLASPESQRRFLLTVGAALRHEEKVL